MGKTHHESRRPRRFFLRGAEALLIIRKGITGATVSIETWSVPAELECTPWVRQ
jgi:hypothetical protein